MSTYYVGGIPYSDTYLAHHGIKGMKWGVRRYQNPDGTLTPAGKKKYMRGAKSVAKYGPARFAIGLGVGGAAVGAFLGAATLLNPKIWKVSALTAAVAGAKYSREISDRKFFKKMLDHQMRKDGPN